MRGLIRQEILAIPELVALIPEDRWFGSGAVGNPLNNEKDTPPRPFAEIRFSLLTPGISHVRRRRCEIWIHDEEGNYDLIDKVIHLLFLNLNGLENVDFSDSETGEDSHLVVAEWVSDSTDLYDTGYRTNTKSTGYDLVGTGA